MIVEKTETVTRREVYCDFCPAGQVLAGNTCSGCGRHICNTHAMCAWLPWSLCNTTLCPECLALSAGPEVECKAENKRHDKAIEAIKAAWRDACQAARNERY